jgi:hypothetical protein
MQKLLDVLEDLDDVQDVFHNAAVRVIKRVIESVSDCFESQREMKARE